MWQRSRKLVKLLGVHRSPDEINRFHHQLQEDDRGAWSVMLKEA